jgi:acetyl-CoA carboxylase biotin carboxyl carrier protein
MADFDIDGDLVRKLAGMLDETGLTEIEFTDGERTIRRRSRAPTHSSESAIPSAPDKRCC